MMRDFIFGVITSFILTVACTQTIPVNVISTSSLSTDETHVLLDDAQDILGMQFNYTDNYYGTIIVDIHAVVVGEPFKGRSFNSAGCIRYIWAHPDAQTIAHEIGHALGLEHVADKTNLMHQSSDGIFLSNNQLDTIERNAAILESCLLND